MNYKNISDCIFTFSCLALFNFSWSQNVLPTVTAGRYTLDIGANKLEISEGRGGRVMSLIHAGEEVLYLDSNGGNNNFGSTFWPSPQAGWKPSSWPPPYALDPGPYTGSIITADSSIVMVSQEDTGNNLRISKTFWGNPVDTSFTIHYALINTSSSAAIQWGPWEITRYAAGGVTFYPTGEGAKTGDLASLIEDMHGISWFKYDDATVPRSGTPKLYADGSEGWLAHITDEKVMVLKKFTDTPPSQKAPDPENEIELYTDPGHAYQEIEQQGPYTEIAPGDSLVWEVKWYVRTVEPQMAPDPNIEILEFIYKVLDTPTTRILTARGPSARYSLSGKILEFYLRESAPLDVSLINLQGKKVKSLFSGKFAEGSHRVVLDDSGLSQGLYFLNVADSNGNPTICATYLVTN